MTGGGNRAEEGMGVKCISMVTKIHTVGCHLATLSGCCGRESADGRADKECEKGRELTQINNIINIF